MDTILPLTDRKIVESLKEPDSAVGTVTGCGLEGRGSVLGVLTG